MSKSLKWLCVSVFILMGMPRMSLKIGPIPLYMIDLLIVITFFYAKKIQTVDHGKRPFAGVMLAIITFMVLSELSTAVIYGSPLQPTYILVRSLLAVSLFYSASKIIRSEDDLVAVIKAGAAGLIITAGLMMMSSLPFTRGIVTSYIFSISFLEPASVSTVKKYMVLEGAMRGRSLVGVSILSGAFINTFWPLVALLYRWPASIGRWRTIALAGSILAPLGVVMSYSRGAILGLILVVAAVIFFGSGRSRGGIIIAVVFGLSVFSFVGWQSDNFYFERIQKRTEIMFDNPYKDEQETERLYAYSEPFAHLIDNPRFLLMGEGTSVGKIAGATAESAGAANHAVFAQAYYSYGLVASFLYIFLVLRGFGYLWGEIRVRNRDDSIAELYAQALFAGLAGMLPWFVFGHAAISTPRGAMLFFLLFGMMASLKNFPYGKSSTVTV